MFLSADKRKISYRSKNGSMVTLSFQNPSSKATDCPSDGAREDLTKEGGAEAGMQAQTHPSELWAGLYDSLSFWVGEAVEIACFGPHDEPLAR